MLLRRHAPVRQRGAKRRCDYIYKEAPATRQYDYEAPDADSTTYIKSNINLPQQSAYCRGFISFTIPPTFAQIPTTKLQYQSQCVLAPPTGTTGSMLAGMPDALGSARSYLSISYCPRCTNKIEAA